MDAANDLVTVKGTMNVKTLPDVLKEKIKRSVEIVPSKKEEEKKGPKDKSGSEKKEEGKKGGDKKEKEKEEGKKQEAVAAPPPAAAAASMTTAAVAEANRMDYYAPYPYAAGYGYRVEMVHAPQMFSDENPNACTIM